MPIGPQFPPFAEKRKRTDEAGSSDSDDSVGPMPPKTDTEGNTTKKPRVVGPVLPPSRSDEQPKPGPIVDPYEDSSSDDDDDDNFGPSLPTETDKQKASLHAGATISRTEPAQPVPAKSQRDEWMSLAPTSGDWSQRVDPTKLKSRKFNTGKSTTASSSSGADAWHETPEQKQARLQREVLGIKDTKASKTPTTQSSTSKADAETLKRMKEYNAQRGSSLYEAHQKGKKVEEEDDPSARAFDREKDIGGGLQINATQRREMMKKSSDFNSRFSSAKYL